MKNATFQLQIADPALDAQPVEQKRAGRFFCSPPKKFTLLRFFGGRSCISHFAVLAFL
jgi:hypothetical protein